MGGGLQSGEASPVDPSASGAERLAQYAESTLSAAADHAGLSVSKVTELIEAEKAIVSQNGVLSYTDVFDGADEHGESDAPPAGDVPGDPAGGSKPGAPYTIYLDFDGATVENTEWNRYYEEDVYELAPAAGAGDDDYEYEVWATVAEDFAPFNINVTTTDPGEDALLRTSEDDGEFGMTVVITDTVDIAPAEGASGRAWLNGFGNAFYSPALVFAPNARQGNARDVGNTASHEAGHTFGLAHHGIDDDEYYGDTPAEPDSLWGPIMGAPWFTPLSQWSNGDYPGASQPDQDDVAEIANTDATYRQFVLYNSDGSFYLEGMYCTDADDPNNPAPGSNFWAIGPNGDCDPPGEELTAEFNYGGRAAYADDDHSNGMDGASALDNASGEFTATGIVETSDDRDMFELVTSGGPVSVNATPATTEPNLDILLEVYDSEGNLVAEDNPEAATDLASPPTGRTASGLDASIEQELDGGVYYVAVSGTGKGDPADNTASNGSGYTSYGSLGNYELSGTAEPFDAAPITITAPEDGAEVEPSDLEVTGTAEPGAAVSLTIGDDTVADATADDEGNWTATVAELAYGNSTITAQQTVGDIVVPQTAEVSVVVPVDAPAISKPEDGDTATTATPVFSGTGIAGATVNLTVTCGDDFTLEGEATVDDEGNWEYKAEENLPTGECSVVATQTINDVTSSEAGPVGFTVDVDSDDDDNGDDNGSEEGTEDGDDDLPDTGASSSNLIALAGGLVLLGLGAALYARTRRNAMES
ncbi:Ig-like domain-containing protein [Haloactinopolyspora sp.]|uniref:Ig-like domain-containing protein n=1 Tax=Haloactinopolyspora sp. TaxID=1966353 RepID=UPI0026345C94|nr:Ig-like domain-containing protein [Haloactinopolyspora sp.]